MVVTGISWIRTGEHGTACRGRVGTQASLRELYGTLCADETIRIRFKNFGRFDEESRRVCLAVALALQDSGLVPGNGAAHDTGLLISSVAGARSACLAYFDDYVREGRKLGRGNLFIYTLPTSPAAEAAIHFGLTGPLLYIGRPSPAAEAALWDGVDIVRSGQTSSMLCTVIEDSEVICAAVQTAPLSHQASVTVEEAAAFMTGLRGGNRELAFERGWGGDELV